MRLNVATFELRAYQDKMIRNLAVMIHTGKRRIVGQLATGGGKTVIFCAISQRYTAKSGKRVLILVNRIELLEQTRLTAYNAFGITCQHIVAGMKHIPDADIYVGMVESVNNRVLKLSNIGLVIIDECHIGSFNKLHQHFTQQIIIGFTATPLSASKKLPLKTYYEDIVCGVDIPDLIAQGALCQNVTWAPKETVDRLQLAVRGNDFDEQNMMQAFSKPKYISNTISAYERWAKGTKTIIFNVNIFHSKEVTKAFQAAGYDCRHLDGEMAKDDRKEILQWFKETPDAILCNVAVATTGFDEPSIETVIVNKATMSMPLWLQMCGRGGRPTPSKLMFTIIDMGGNAVVHGDWCNPRDWYGLFHNPPKPGASTTSPVKNCPQCDAIIPASAKQCPFCGYLYPAKEIPLEIALHDFIVITKGIDVAALTAKHQNKKLYYVFYEIGRQIVANAAKTVEEMDDERAAFVIGEYFKRGKEWANSHKKRFEQWHKNRAMEFALEQLKLNFQTWQPKETTLDFIKTELKIK